MGGQYKQKEEGEVNPYDPEEDIADSWSTVLYFACCLDRTPPHVPGARVDDILCLLIDSGAEVNISSVDNHNTPLMAAALRVIIYSLSLCLSLSLSVLMSFM